jgi:pimeloyl-ACP methyl ester carboxylesterase
MRGPTFAVISLPGAAVLLAGLMHAPGARGQAPAPPPPPPPQPAVEVAAIDTPREESMVDVGGRRLRCVRYGKGVPAVVLISGFRAGQVYWNPLVPTLAGAATVVTYDRPGYGTSELGTAPNHGLQAAADLHRLLHAIGVPAPYVVVGHSYGGRIARLFASTYPDTVAALLLEETTHEDVLDEQLKALEGPDREQLAAMSASFRQRVASPRTEAEYMLDTLEQLRASAPLPPVPLVVLWATDGGGLPKVFTAEGEVRLREVNARMQQRLAALVPNGRLIGIPGVGHNVHLEKPEAVLEPLLALIEQVKSGAR